MLHTSSKFSTRQKNKIPVRLSSKTDRLCRERSIRHLQMVFRVEAAQLHPAQKLAERDETVAVRVAELKMEGHLVLRLLCPSFAGEMFLLLVPQGDGVAP